MTKKLHYPKTMQSNDTETSLHTAHDTPKTYKASPFEKNVPLRGDKDPAAIKT